MRACVAPPTSALVKSASRFSASHAFAIVAIGAALALSAVPDPAHGEAPPGSNGRIHGRIGADANELGHLGGGLAECNVVLVGTERGAKTGPDGVFRIDGVPLGTYMLRATYLGYTAAERRVEVSHAAETWVEVTLVPSVLQIDDVIVRAPVNQIDDSSTEKHVIDRGVLENAPIDEIDDLIDGLAGVTVIDGDIHVRGQRPNATDQRIDGVSIKDPLGGRAGDVSLASLEHTEAITGAMQAKHGATLAGVVNHTTREGGEHVSGFFRYVTDDFGAPDKTFNNLDRVLVGVGGPLPVRRLTYFVSAQGTWSDAYPATRERRPSRRILDFISVSERKVNDVRLHGKLAWRPDVPTKMTLEVLSNRTTSDRYHHNWSWDGYVQTVRDTLTTGDRDIVTRIGRWSAHQEDESFRYYNAAEHTPNVEQSFSLHKLTYTRAFGEGESFVNVKLARTQHAERQRVNGKSPWEYDIDGPQHPYLDTENGVLSSYFVRAGDMPVWSNAVTKVTSVHVDRTHRVGKHVVEAGGVFRYNDIHVQNVSSMFVGRDGSEDFGVRDRYRVYQNEGGVYVQDSVEHEGLVLNLGVRYDGFSVGQQLDEAEVDDRVKWQLSPRIGIAYPVTDRDVFSFHYGRYYQYPERHQVFENRDAIDGRTIGNPNLGPETTVAYQAAVQHVFSETVSGQLALYYQDLFGLIDTRLVPVTGSANELPQYVNRAYASSRGFEVTLRRSFASGFTGQVAYTYGRATGVASDPSTAATLGLRYYPLAEQPLNWDQRHVFSARFTIDDPGNVWSLSGTWSLRSGTPYTPRERNTRDTEPETINARRLPGSSTLDLRATRRHSVWGRELEVFIEANNALDARSIARLAGSTPLPSPAFDPAWYTVYYTETGNVGGAYLAPDRDGDGAEDWVPLNDPTTVREGREVRVGLSFMF